MNESDDRKGNYSKLDTELSIGSERELDNLNDLENSSRMSWPGGEDCRDGARSPLAPGFQSPPHHSHHDTHRKQTSKPREHNWDIDISERIKQDDDDNDIPVFSVVSKTKVSDKLSGDASKNDSTLVDKFNNNVDNGKQKRRKRKERKSEKEQVKKQSESLQLLSQPKSQHFSIETDTPKVDEKGDRSIYGESSTFAASQPPLSKVPPKPSPFKQRVSFQQKSNEALESERDDVELNYLDTRRASTSSAPNNESTGILMDSASSFTNRLTFRSSTRSLLDKKKKRLRLNDQPHIAKFINGNIQQRECSIYSRNRQNDQYDCCCGRNKKWHTDNGAVVNDPSKTSVWNQRTHTRTTPCDSFGEIHFRGFGSSTEDSPYARIDFETNPEIVWDLLIDYWRLPSPRLLISVTGGAQRFELQPRLSTVLKQGLVEAAINTGAWIITGGTAAGVMEFVGEAVRDHITLNGQSKDKQCVALGIAPWGCVNNNMVLDGEDENGLFPATYAIEDVLKKKKGFINLDRNHTHFLLIDNGTEGAFGSEIEYRAKLEKYISKVGTTGVSESQVIHTPVVLIVVEGGTGTLETVYQSIKQKTPVVIINGSGRAADYLAKAYNMTKQQTDKDEETTSFPNDFDNHMKELANSIFVWKTSGTEKEKQIQKSVDMTKDCLKNRNLINVFDLSKSNHATDIDRAILHALLRANKSNCNSQLALALAWNRCDIARQQIFTSENRGKWKIKDLYDAMFTALVQNRPDFVQLFLDNGVSLKKFLTVKTLWNLYANQLSDETDGEAALLRHSILFHKQNWLGYLRCRRLIEWEDLPKQDLLHLVNRVIIHLLYDESFVLYKGDEFKVPSEVASMEWKGDLKTLQPLVTRISSQTADVSEREQSYLVSHDSAESLLHTSVQGSVAKPKKRKIAKEQYDFQHPELHLFLFSVLFNRREMCKLFLKLGQDQLAVSLVGSSLLKAVADLAETDEETGMSENLKEHALDLEKFAVGILDICYKRNKTDAHLLLVREIPQLGNITVITLADVQELMDFAEHAACQTKLSEIWKGSLSTHTSELKIAATLLFPPLIFFMKFNMKKSEALEDEDEKTINELSDNPTRNNITSPSRGDSTDQHFSEARSRTVDTTRRTTFAEVRMFSCQGEEAINVVKAIHKFYKAPVTKFYANIIAYLIFLGLFSFFLLTNMKPVTEPDSPSTIEFIVWIWFATMIIEEVRQVVSGDQRSASYKVRHWWSSPWNKFDLLMSCGVITSISLRYTIDGGTFVVCRILYSITLNMCYLRLMQYFFAEKNMGPKVIMIRRMLTDLLFFFLILLVFVLSFGVSYHVNMFPNSPLHWSVFYNVLQYPYFQMYGELFFEDLKGEDVNDCTRNESIWTSDPTKRCPEKNAVVPIMLAVYMLLTNILLVNLLIAMFSYTFQTVQDISTKVWRFNRISLVYEYHDRPTLVPPVIILNHAYRVVKYFRYRSDPTKRRKNAFKKKIESNDYLRLTLFEKSAMESFLTVSSLMEREQLDRRVASTAERIELVMDELQNIKEVVQSTDTAKSEKQQNLNEVTEIMNPRSNRLVESVPQHAMMLDMMERMTELQKQAAQNTVKLAQLQNMLERLVVSPSAPRHLPIQPGQTDV